MEKNTDDEKEDKIIVYAHYNSPFDANIAKTKLDAYGIPCFLSDENLAGLGILMHQSIGRVRLHVFEADKERAAEILKETE